MEEFVCPKCGEEEQIYGDTEGVFCRKCGYRFPRVYARREVVEL